MPLRHIIYDAKIGFSLLIIGIFLALSCQIAAAQNSSSNADIIGLKLGLTMKAAEDVIHTYNANMMINTLYATDEIELIPYWGDRGRIIIPDDASIVEKSKIKIPIAMIASIKAEITSLQRFSL